MQYSTLLFDVDGTLFDYTRAETVAFRTTIEACGVAYRPDLLDEFRAINHGLWGEFERGELSQQRLRSLRFERLFEGCGYRQLDAVAVGESYLDQLSLRGDLLAGARELLEAIDGEFALAVITNGIARVQHARLDHSGLRAFFAAIVISGEVGVAKPDPRIFEIALQQLGNPARNRVLMIGDSLSSDIRGAVDAGIDACWIRSATIGCATPQSGARYEVETLSELAALLGG